MASYNNSPLLSSRAMEGDTGKHSDCSYIYIHGRPVDGHGYLALSGGAGIYCLPFCAGEWAGVSEAGGEVGHYCEAN